MVGLPLATHVVRVEADQLKPTDVIVIEAPGAISAADRETIRQCAKHVWPGHTVVVLDRGLTVRIVIAEA
jgi:hypothetical protein